MRRSSLYIGRLVLFDECVYRVVNWTDIYVQIADEMTGEQQWVPIEQVEAV